VKTGRCRQSAGKVVSPRDGILRGHTPDTRAVPQHREDMVQPHGDMEDQERS
jgi:hypothetical protein